MPLTASGANAAEPARAVQDRMDAEFAVGRFALGLTGVLMP
jgi:hypothetical protein